MILKIIVDTYTNVGLFMVLVATINIGSFFLNIINLQQKEEK